MLIRLFRQATICKGAAWAGLRNLQPQSRQARRHYGFSLCEPYNPDVHQLHDTYMHAWHGIAYARNNMYWGLKKVDAHLDSSLAYHTLTRCYAGNPCQQRHLYRASHRRSTDTLAWQHQDGDHQVILLRSGYRTEKTRWIWLVNPGAPGRNRERLTYIRGETCGLSHGRHEPD